MKRSLYVNYAANLLFQVFSVIAPLITTPYVSRVLQADGVGTYSYTYSIATMFVTIAQFGTGVYGQREIAYKRDDLAERSRVFWNVVLLRFVAVAVSLAIYYPIFASGQYGNIFIIQSLCIIGAALDITWFYQGLEKFDFVAARDIICKIVSIVCVFLFVNNKEDVGLYTFILAMSVIGGRITCWLPLRKYLGTVSLKSINIFENFKDILALFAPLVATQLSYVIDKSMIGLLTNNTFENGYYAQAERIITLVMSLSTSIVTVMFPRVAALFVQKKEEEINALVNKTIRFLWLLCIPAGIGITLVIDMVVPWFMGSGYDEVVPLTQLMSIKFVIVSMSNCIGTLLLVARKKQKQFVTSTVVGTVSSVILNALLIPFIYARGAVVASVISCLFSYIVQLIYVRKELSLWKILREALPYLIPAATMTLAILLVKPFLSATVIHTVLIVAVGIVVYGAMLLLTREKLTFGILKKIIEMLKNKRSYG